MGLNNVFAAVLGATLVAWSGMSAADEYRPGELLTLDLSKAVLSPKLLGPATQFAPVQNRGARRSRQPGAVSARRPRHARQDPSASAGGKTARRRSHEAGAAARQSARRPGVRYADSGVAVQVRRHLQLEVMHRRSQAHVSHGATNR